MGNFLQDVGRSKFSSEISNMINTKLAFDASERADVQSANASALSAEQLIQARNANRAAAEKEKDLNTPIPLKILKMGMVDNGEGPITKHLEEKADAMGYINRTNPDAPYILKKHIMPGGEIEKMMSQDVEKIHSLTTQYANSLIDQAREIQAQKPDDKQAAAMMDKGTKLLNQMTYSGPELEKRKLEKGIEVERMKEEAANARNRETTRVAEEGHKLQYSATINAAKLRLEHEKANDPNAKMPPDVKMAFDYIKKFTESTTPSPVMAMMAAGAGPDSPAAKALAQQQKAAQDPEVQNRLAIANKKVEDYISKGMGVDDKGTGLPDGLDEATIQYNMKQYGKSREEVIAKYKQVKGLK
jgi:hypothetical protein